MTPEQSINVAIVGAAGRMGLAVLSAANDFERIKITHAVLNQGDVKVGRPVYPDVGQVDTGLLYVDERGIDYSRVDVMIDFSTQASSLFYAQRCAEYGKKIMIGTTGFDGDDIAKLKRHADSAAVLLSPNTSLGVNVVLNILKHTAKAIGAQADVEIIEAHHRNKLDAPSGTALRMGEVIAQSLEDSLQNRAVFSRHGVTEIRQDNDIGFSVVRAGDIIGDHTVLFSLPGERIEITHKATDRSLFAKGAIQTAIWLSQQNNGWYTMEDMLNLEKK